MYPKMGYKWGTKEGAEVNLLVKDGFLCTPNGVQKLCTPNGVQMGYKMGYTMGYKEGAEMNLLVKDGDTGFLCTPK